MAEGTRLMPRLASDDALREAMKTDPKGVLRREGVAIPDEMEVKVVESTTDTLYIALPPKVEAKREGELSDEQLEGIAGGGGKDPGFTDLSSSISSII